MPDRDNVRLQAGDVFIKRWGGHFILLMMMPRTGSSRKRPYARLHRMPVTFESTYSTTRGEFKGRWSRRNEYKFLGQVPEGWIEDVLKGR